MSNIFWWFYLKSYHLFGENEEYFNIMYKSAQTQENIQWCMWETVEAIHQLFLISVTLRNKLQGFKSLLPKTDSFLQLQASAFLQPIFFSFILTLFTSFPLKVSLFSRSRLSNRANLNREILPCFLFQILNVTISSSSVLHLNVFPILFFSSIYISFSRKFPLTLFSLHETKIETLHCCFVYVKNFSWCSPFFTRLHIPKPGYQYKEVLYLSLYDFSKATVSRTKLG